MRNALKGAVHATFDAPLHKDLQLAFQLLLRIPENEFTRMDGGVGSFLCLLATVPQRLHRVIFG